MNILASSAAGQVANQLGVPLHTTARAALNVERATSSLEDAMSELINAVSYLEEVVNPILRPLSDANQCHQRTPGESDLAERILQTMDKVERLTVRVNSIISRL